MQGKKCSHGYNKLVFNIRKAIAHHKSPVQPPNTNSQIRAELQISHTSSFFYPVFLSPEHLFQILVYYYSTKIYFNHFIRDFFANSYYI